MPPTPLWQREGGRVGEDGQVGPLFSPDQQERLRALPREAPLLFRGTGSSTASSEVQAEVQRQLRHYVQRYEGEASDLRSQVERLTRERDQLLRAEAHTLLRTPEGRPEQERVPPGDRAYGGVPLMIGRTMAFHLAIGLTMAFQQVIGLSVAFHLVIGLSVAFQQQVGQLFICSWLCS